MGTRIDAYTLSLGQHSMLVMDCASCGVVYGFDSRYEQRRREDKRSWVCPNGHSQVFVGKSGEEKQRERADRAERQRDMERTARLAAEDQRRATERSRIALKGHMTRMRNRIANGVCPVAGCKRSFHKSRVTAHIRTKHPDWAEQHPAALLVLKKAPKP